MGVAMSVLAKLGFHGVDSLSTDRIFDKYFSGDIRDFDKFHIAFLNFCNDFNGIMPGMHYTAPPRDKIRECFEKWKSERSDEKRKEMVLSLLKEHVTVFESDNSAVVMAGLVAPPAAMVLKRAGENMPQLKKFRLNFIPDIFFVPTCTVAAVIGVKVLQIKSSNAP